VRDADARLGRGGPEAGFLYVESLVALLILSFVLLAMVPLFVMAAREGAASADITLVTTFAQDKADELKMGDYDALTAGADTMIIGGLTYARAWTIDSDVPQPGMKTIAVTVTPSRGEGGRHGGDRTYQMSFFRVE